MKATELERAAQELVDNLNHNVVNQVPSDKQIRHGEAETRGHRDMRVLAEAVGREPEEGRYQPNQGQGRCGSCRA